MQLTASSPNSHTLARFRGLLLPSDSAARAGSDLLLPCFAPPSQGLRSYVEPRPAQLRTPPFAAVFANRMPHKKAQIGASVSGQGAML